MHERERAVGKYVVVAVADAVVVVVVVRHLPCFC